MSKSRTRDPVNKIVIDVYDEIGLARIGIMNNQVWHADPRRLVFTLSRYKFVSKMLSGRKNVLEVGCGDAFCSRVVKQEVERLTVTDYDPLFIEDARARMQEPWAFDAMVHDILEGPVPGSFDAAYSLDVMEHIHREQENIYLNNIKGSLDRHGTLIIGMPSLESQSFASPGSRDGHVNCKTGEDLRQVLGRHFHNIFLFSMNDEVVHTGFNKMAHYLIAVCCSKIE
jgi:2-polyprenyl-3-methyl-5-hydroxy-6-metoxy-1,4-benzoquinol methylase